MQQNLINEDNLEELKKVSFLVGNKDVLKDSQSVPVFEPFDDSVLEFLNALSKNLMARRAAKAYPDVVTFGFWIRKSSMLKLKERFHKEDGNIHLGRGIAFHIAPSNVPVNYAYSLITGLITGNINIVRVPSKDFPQVSIINAAINETLEAYRDIKKYIYLVRYDRSQKINNVFSAIADVRIVWGGDNTIAELRKSPMGARATEVTFADRYSLAVIDSDYFVEAENKERFIDGFYNDTFLSDQNACTSPRIVVWTGSHVEGAREAFWKQLHDLVEQKYEFQSIMGVNKLTSAYIAACALPGIKMIHTDDNLIVRLEVMDIDDKIMALRDNSGFFFEYVCEDIFDLKTLCDDNHIQTIGYLGDNLILKPLVKSGIKGIDRVVPIGKTMDFDFIWDGYNLYERLSRTIAML